jgi:hypothetical protein
MQNGLPLMSEIDDGQPHENKSTRPPPRRHWKATEPFFDLKFSHWIEIALTITLVGFSCLQYTIYRRQAGIMEQQTKISEADHRPWVSANPITLVGNLAHDDSGLQMTMQFNLKNTGHSPARKVFASFTATTESWGPQNSRQVCNDAEKSLFGLAVFPGDTIMQGIGSKIPESEFDKIRRDIEKGRGEMVESILPSVGACIVYQDMETEALHHTYYNFFLSLPGDKSPIKLMLDQHTMPGSSFVLVSMPNAPAPD